MPRDTKRDKISADTYRRMYEETRRELLLLRAERALAVPAESTVLDELVSLMADQGGYGRFGKSLNGHYWVRWKWSVGRWAGRYAIGGHDILEDAFWHCLSDVQRVLEGKKTPPLDVGYTGKNRSQSGG